jgi:GNAT superfamily N-acetyltransferase
MTRRQEDKRKGRREEASGIASSIPPFLPSSLPALHELLAHSHLLTERQRRLGSIGPVGPLLCVHSQAERDGETVAVDRFFAGACSPTAALLAMRSFGPARDHLLFVVDAPAERQRAFVRAGFRLLDTQWLMGCDLAQWQPSPPPTTAGTVHRARATADAVTLSAIDGLEPVPLDELHDPALVHYYTASENHPVAYGRNARYDSTIAWVSQVYTAPQHRRMGHASALMEQLLMDDARAGVAHSMLLATAMAHLLYAGMGYVDVAAVAILQAPPALLRRSTR